MILVLSQDTAEPTTELVMDWIEALGGHCARLNGEDLNAGEGFTVRLDRGGCDLVLRVAGRDVTVDEVRAVWLRRWHRLENLGLAPLLDDPQLRNRVSHHLAGELAAAFQSLHTLLRGAKWLTHPADVRVAKLAALRTAARAGLDVPASLVTNTREALRDFKARYGRIITKPLGEAETFPCAGESYLMYTAELSDQDVENAPELFFPSLAQELLEKKYELRVFYLDGACYAMAIFSQLDGRTALDFRRYNHKKPNRSVPYRLPPQVERGVCAFMEAMRLSTGSLDLVRTTGGRYVFLEVNPAGQFGMVSDPCNYNLERRVAEALIRRDTDGRD
ncbi:MAG TPA: grasp-with-spasm system ATP-grasp peptide maturase [Longimicrobium sp.]|nr:grasp-with-spasm system ATP-grasp peptide maturase [Longimicrobium sp.]